MSELGLSSLVQIMCIEITDLAKFVVIKPPTQWDATEWGKYIRLVSLRKGL